MKSCDIVTGITAHNQFIHLHGQRGARLDHDQSVYGSVYPRTLLLIIVSPFFLWAPGHYFEALGKICVDGLVHIDAWIKFIDKLKVDTQKFLLIVMLFRIRIQYGCAYCQLQATVLLGANMGFLSIQSVDANGSKVKNRSPAQIAIYVSIVLSLGSIIMSLLLVGEDPETKEEVVCISWIYYSAFQLINFLFYQGIYLGYLKKRRHNVDTRRLDTLAILFSLPYALLMWSYAFRLNYIPLYSNHIFCLSLLSFIVAFGFTCFSFSDRITRFLVGGASIAVIFLWSVTLYIQRSAKVTGGRHHLRFP